MLYSYDQYHSYFLGASADTHNKLHIKHMEKEFKLATGTVCRTQLEHKIYDLIAKTLHSIDYTIIRIRVFKSGDKHVVQMMLEKNDGTSITISDCEKASRCASNILDANDPMSEESYNLEVSSTGINRPLTRPEDFTTFIGSKIRLKTLTKIDGQGVFTGIIEKSDGKNVVISDSFSQSTTVIEINNIVDAKLEIETQEKSSEDNRRSNRNFDDKRVSGRNFGDRKPRFSSDGGERKSFGDRGPRRDGERRNQRFKK